MGFLSYNLGYYERKIQSYETHVLSKEDRVEAKRLLKLAEDLADEGYDDLLVALQREYCGVERLKEVIKANGGTPFPVVAQDKRADRYGNERIELSSYIDGLLARSGGAKIPDDNAFLHEITAFCESIGYEKDVAYVFLLRDTLLPYLYFKVKHADHLYPWILSRSFLQLISEEEQIDDLVRETVFDALERGYVDFQSFRDYCKTEIMRKLAPYPAVEDRIKGLLSQIGSERILVVETGCYGTFPLLLSALDERVEFRLYTTVPYLTETYQKQIYSAAYENLRTFETLACHDKLFRLADFADGRFYVSENCSQGVVDDALCEIGFLLKQAQKR